MEIYYEDLLLEPGKVMEIILNFLDIDEKIYPAQGICSIRPERRLAYLQDNSLKNFYRDAEKNELLLDLYSEINQSGRL